MVISDAFRQLAREEGRKALEADALRRVSAEDHVLDVAGLAVERTQADAQRNAELAELTTLARDISDLARERVDYNRIWRVSGQGQTWMDRRARGRVLDRGWAIAGHVILSTNYDPYDGTSRGGMTELILHDDGELTASEAPYGVDLSNLHELHVITPGKRQYQRVDNSEANHFPITERVRALAEFAGRHALV